MGSLQYITDVKVKGMLHARVIRPPNAGCGPVSVDESSIKKIRGARVVRDENSSRWSPTANGTPCAPPTR